MSLSPTDFLIEDGTSTDLLFDPVVDGVPRARGLVPRNYDEHPEEMFAPPSDMELIDKSEWSDRIKEQERAKSRLSDIRLHHLNGQMIPSLDQGQVGYCWSHSTTHCTIIGRAVSNQPYIPLSAYAVASIIKSGRDEGGWCGLSAEFLRKTGVPSQALWPQGNRSLTLDTPQMRANAALHKTLEDWVDLTRRVYDQNLTFSQLATCLLNNIPCAVDFNWWGHSVCALDLVEVESGSFGIRIWNSWSDGWGDRGMGVLRGGKEVPNGAVALRVSGVSPM